MQVSPKSITPLLVRWGQHAEVENLGWLTFCGVSYDSRSVAPGHAFFCVVGEREDGNAFIPDAVKRGAVVIISEQRKPEGLGQIPYVRVPDIRRAMSETADYLYDQPSKRLRVLGVTGTNGKTSTTHLIEHILNLSGQKAGLVGTMGARWPQETNGKQYIDAHHTTPQAADLHHLLFDMLQDGVSHVAMEVSSHALALKRVDNCQFASACLTNITQDHLDFHKTMEHYWKSKLLLFTALNTSEQSNKYAVVNIDEPLAPEFLGILDKSIKKLTYSAGTSESRSYSAGEGTAENARAENARSRSGSSRSSSKADFRATDIHFDQTGTHMKVQTPSGVLEVKLKLVGQFNVYNALAALTVCSAEGVPNEVLKRGLESFTGVSGRFEVVSSSEETGANATDRESIGKEPLCIVDYAHSPDGLENVLKVARELVPAGGRLIVVFGCGGDRDTSKRPQMGAIAESLADLVVVTSDNPRSEDPQQIIVDILAGIQRMRSVLVEADRAKAIEMTVLDANANDVVVVAGKGHETYQIIKGKTFDFDDRVEVQKALSKRQQSTV